MSDIHALKNEVQSKTLTLVLLTLATMGIYPILWLQKNQPILNRITQTRIAGDGYVIWIAVCAGFNSAFTSMALSAASEMAFDLANGLSAFSVLLGLAAGILYIVWAFMARKALQSYALNIHHMDLRMNPFYTFFLSIFYINYCINDLAEEKKKQEILRSKLATGVSSSEA